MHFEVVQQLDEQLQVVMSSAAKGTLAQKGSARAASAQPASASLGTGRAANAVSSTELSAPAAVLRSPEEESSPASMAKVHHRLHRGHRRASFRHRSADGCLHGPQVRRCELRASLSCPAHESRGAPHDRRASRPEDPHLRARQPLLSARPDRDAHRARPRSRPSAAAGPAAAAAARQGESEQLEEADPEPQPSTLGPSSTSGPTLLERNHRDGQAPSPVLGMASAPSRRAEGIGEEYLTDLSYEVPVLNIESASAPMTVHHVRR